ncbi:membrane anchor subunit of succinate dehydrogenase, Sdh4 [Podochytrium sp. JEL0797]|nr:membrane anchor subunit of succinate dehydrogenase, Sdh4 [Podochytrium sp. JEL0797]
MAERFYSFLLIPCLATALVAGPVTINDLLLGVLLPVHVHMGFDCMIQDYIPARKFGKWHTVSTWGLRVVTGLVLYSLFVFNTMDVGITSFVQRLWAGRSERVLRVVDEQE